jgi:hypothetical protein
VTAPSRQDPLAQLWQERWGEALAAWSNYTLLRPPIYYEDHQQAAADGMDSEIAAIRLHDQRIMVNLATVRERGLEEHALAILAHEIGHHVYAPGNARDSAKVLAAIGRMLVGLPPAAVHLAANLYEDLLINDRLYRRGGIDVAAVYRSLVRRDEAPSRTWQVYSRTYEHLWHLAPGTLAVGEIDGEMDADAMLLARIVRSFAGDWLRGARRFAAVLHRYLAQDEEQKAAQTFTELGLHDTRRAHAPAGGASSAEAIPDGMTEIDPSELEDDEAFDRDILDPLGESTRTTPGAPPAETPRAPQGQSGGQHRQPFEYAQVLRALGLQLSDREIAIRYYRERALPHLIPFPSRRAPQVTEPVAEGYEDWSAGDPLEALDPVASVLNSPFVVPGVTTVQRAYGDAPGTDPARTPLDLDIYVDCSGSMPNPRVDVSYLALAGTILALSALRAGGRVQATLWSGPGRFDTTSGFVRDEQKVLGIVTGYLGGSTAFPLHVLRDTYAARKPSDHPAHVIVISDDGVDTMLQRDEKGSDGAKLCTDALARARGGGTLVLNLPPTGKWPARGALEELGFHIHAVTRWEDLVAFAREFVRENYGEAR